MKKILSIILALSLVLGLALTVSAAGQTTVTKKASEMGWSDATKYTTMQIDSVVKATMNGTDSNTGKYYNNGTNWRMYQSGNATLKIEATGSTIISVKVTYTPNNNGTLKNGSTNVASGTVVPVNAESITFGIGNTGSATNGQVRITEIQVVYGDASAPCTHEYVNEYAAACKLCGEPRTVALPAANTVITYEQAQKLYDAGVTNTIYRVTGVIDEVYNTTYGNMYLKDANGNKFTVYGLYTDNGSTRYDAMTTKPVADDTVTVSGKLSAYQGTVQISSAWLVEHTPAQREACTEHVYTNEYDATCNNTGCTTGTREVTLPEADKELTFEVAGKVCAAQDHNTFTTNKYYITGEITEIYNEEYGNMKIKDANGTIITLYGTYSADGETRFDALEEKPAVGDTITVYGVLGRYNDTMQMKNGWIQEEPANTADNTPVVALITLCVLSAAAFVTMSLTKKREF